MSLPDGFTPFSEVTKANERKTTIVLDVTSEHTQVIGKFLQALESMVEAVGLHGTITAEGYERTFYGWDEKQ